MNNKYECEDYNPFFCEGLDCCECPYCIAGPDLCEFELPTGDDLTNCH